MSAVAENRSIAYSAETAGRAGRIACQVIRSDSSDENRVSYAIAVRNDTDSNAQALAFVPDSLDLHRRTIVHSVIGAHSNFTTAVELHREGAGDVSELHVQLSGDDIAFALIVPNPAPVAVAASDSGPKAPLAALALANRSVLPAAVDGNETLLARPHPLRVAQTNGAYFAPPTRRLRSSPSALPMFVLFLAIVATLSLVIFRPSVGELVVPLHLQPGTTIPIIYRATGIGVGAYRVVGPDGRALASGPLSTGSGTFAITLPTDRSDRSYLVRVSISGVLGTAFAEAYLKIPATAVPRAAVVTPTRPPAPSPPQIRSFAVDRAALASGEKLNVYYDVSAASGTVALLDAASQIAYGKSDLSGTGRTTFVIPVVTSERFLTVVLTARRGAATTQSRVAVTAEPQTGPTPPADGNADSQALPAGGTGVLSAPVIVTPTSVRSGAVFRIDIEGAVPELVLVLSDNNGAELARRQVDARAATSTAMFTAPRVRAVDRVRLQAIYPQGSGSETIVKTIIIIPR